MFGFIVGVLFAAQSYESFRDIPSEILPHITQITVNYDLLKMRSSLGTEAGFLTNFFGIIQTNLSSLTALQHLYLQGTFGAEDIPLVQAFMTRNEERLLVSIIHAGEQSDPITVHFVEGYTPAEAADDEMGRADSSLF